MKSKKFYEVYYSSYGRMTYYGYAKKRKNVDMFITQRGIGNVVVVEVDKDELQRTEPEFLIEPKYLMSDNSFRPMMVMACDDEIFSIETKFQSPEFIYGEIEDTLDENIWYIDYSILKKKLRTALDLLGYAAAFDGMVEYPDDSDGNIWRFISPTTHREMHIIPNIPNIMRDYGIGGERY